MKKDAFYFPHDSNAHHDPKIVSLLVACDYYGIGVFWTFIEILRESSNYHYPYKMDMIEIALSHPQATLKPVFEKCLEVGLLVEKDGFITAPALDKKMKQIDRRREILRQAGRRGYEVKAGLSQAQATLKPPLSSKVKESKGKESIKDTSPKQRASFMKPSVPEVDDYCKERGNSIDPERFVSFYESNGWRVGKNPMKDWRAAVRTWEKNQYPEKEGKASWIETASEQIQKKIQSKI